jgi:hypothetical protein
MRTPTTGTPMPRTLMPMWTPMGESACCCCNVDKDNPVMARQECVCLELRLPTAPPAYTHAGCCML